MRADRWNYQLAKAFDYLEANKHRPARRILEEMVDNGIIRGYKITPAGYIYLQTGSGWTGTIYRVTDFGYKRDYI